MSLKTRLRLLVATLVAVLVLSVSTVYVCHFARNAFEAAAENAHSSASHVELNVSDRVGKSLHDNPQPGATSAETRQRIEQLVLDDPTIQDILSSAVDSSNAILDVSIVSGNGTVLASFNRAAVGKPAPAVTDFDKWKSQTAVGALGNLWDLFRNRENYAVRVPVGIGHVSLPVFSIVVTVRSSFLSHELQPAFEAIAIAFLIAMAVSLALAYMLPALALGPLERVSRRIDQIARGEDPDGIHGEFQEAAEFAVVQSKLNVLGQQFRGARQDAVEMRDSIEHLLQRLEEVVLLFDSQGRLVMAGKPAEQLFGISRDQLLGQSVERVFSPDSLLGATVLKAVRDNQPMRDRVIYFDRPEVGRVRLVVSVEALTRSEGNQPLGVLVRLRDAETRRQLEWHLDLSSKLTAISRLTGGVAHEIKNPLNAIALHLEMVKQKLETSDSQVEPELELIAREVRRLDTVVRTFLNFNKPLEMEVDNVDLAALADEVTLFVEPDAHSRGICVDTDIERPLWIKGDANLLKQALLNVVMNAVEAMGAGGRLYVSARSDGHEQVLTIRDTGSGISREIRDRIFDLYFTTKESGTGIGLALTFRMMQLHNGTIDFASEPGEGTSFYLRFPSALVVMENRLALSQAHS